MKSNKILFTIILFALCLRIIASFFAPPDFVFPDSLSYSKIAHNILEGKGFIESNTIQASRPPIYPIFLSFLYLFHCNLIALRIIQCIIGTLSIVFLYLICKKLFSEKTGLTACFLFAIDPLQIVFCSLILTETIFTFLLLLSTFLLVEIRENNKMYAPFLGIVFAIGSLLRSVMLPFSFFLSGIWLVLSWNQKKLIATTIVVTFVAMMPWIIRNGNLYHAFIPTTTKTGINLYEALGPGATGGPRMTEMKVPKEAASMTEIERDKFLRKKTWEHIKESPYEWISLAGVKFVRLWNVGLNERDLKQKPINVVVIISSVFLYIFGFMGIFLLRRKDFFYIVLPILYTSLIHMVFLGSIRYRVPILPYVDILAALTIIKIQSYFFYRGE